MIKNIFKDVKATHLVIITSILLAASSLHAEESPALESFSDGTKDYLADPARTGSLVGSILAGAALANPLAPLLGSVAGFVIGKTSDYSDRPSNPRQPVYSGRSFIPNEDVQVTTLTGLTGLVRKPAQDAEQKVVLALPQETMTVNQLEETETLEPTIMALTQETGAERIKLQVQLDSACGNVGVSQPLPVHCYYYSQ